MCGGDDHEARIISAKREETAALNTYVVLLRRMTHKSRDRAGVPLEFVAIRDIAREVEVEIQHLFVTAGIFDGMIVCRARTNQIAAHFLDALVGWHTDILLATSHIRVETIEPKP